MSQKKPTDKKPSTQKKEKKISAYLSKEELSPVHFHSKKLMAMRLAL